MNCEWIKLHIDEIADSNGGDDSALHLHLEQCGACRVFYDQRIELLSKLRSLPKIRAPSALKQVVLSNAALARNPEVAVDGGIRSEHATSAISSINAVVKEGYYSARATWFATGFISAIAATMLILMFSSHFNVIDMSDRAARNQETAMTEINAPIDSLQQVNILVTSESSLNNVSFTLTVPDNLRLSGYSSKKLLTWSGVLSKGENLLSVPIVATQAKSGVLIMKIAHQNGYKEYRVKVNGIALKHKQASLPKELFNLRLGVV